MDLYKLMGGKGTTKEVFNLWTKELDIWIGYVNKKDTITSSNFLEALGENPDPAKHLRQVVKTVNKHSREPILKEVNNSK